LSRSDTRSCRVPGCGEPIRFLQLTDNRTVCVDAVPRPDGEFYVIGNYGYEVTPHTPPDTPRYGRHRAECAAWMRMQAPRAGRTRKIQTPHRHRRSA